MRRLLLAAATLLLLGAQDAPSDPVEFTLTPLLGADGLQTIEISVRFRGDGDGETQIALPDRWAGQDGLHERIRDLRLDGGTLAETDNPALRSARHAPGAPLVLRYRLGPLDAADPGFDYEKARPALRPGWFYIHGEGAIAGPADRHSAPARFRWGPVPEGWAVASNLDLFSPRQLTMNDVGGSIFAGGSDLRVVDREVGGQPIRIAIRGDWPFEDAAFADALARVIGAGNSYLEAPAIPFFVSLVPQSGGETGLMSTGGTGRPGGFALASTTNRDLPYLIRLLAHEYGHRWFGRAFGPVADPDHGEYWFTEGFNDFVAAQALVRAGVWDETDYAAHLNEVLLRYGTSAARTLANAELGAAFWQDQAAQQMLYDRGHLFALTLDAARAVRPALARMAGTRDGFPADATQARRFAQAYALGPPAIETMLAGAPIVFAANHFAPCGTLVWVEQPAYASGFRVETRDNVPFIGSVVEGGPAWAAGLRPGMRFVRRVSFRPGDSMVPIVLRIGDDAGERQLSWLPQGDENVRFQRLDLASNRDPTACRARLSGR